MQGTFLAGCYRTDWGLVIPSKTFVWFALCQTYIVFHILPKLADEIFPLSVAVCLVDRYYTLIIQTLLLHIIPEALAIRGSLTQLTAEILRFVLSKKQLHISFIAYMAVCLRSALTEEASFVHRNDRLWTVEEVLSAGATEADLVVTRLTVQ